jgi:protocatechuate 3,4-dioxygenase beta subunit
MKLSRTIAGFAGAVFLLHVVLVGTYAQKADPTAPRAGQDTTRTSRPNRQLRNSGMYAAARRPRDRNTPPWQPPPIPATIPIHVAGVARDEAGKAIAGATITLYTMTDKGSKPVGTATTDAEGRYLIRDAIIPVSTSFGGHPFPKEITPYAGFILSGLAPGLGIAWSPQNSMYALKEPHPDDIQGRLPLGHPVALDLTFPKAAVLKGTVVDEHGQPVEGAKLQVLDSDLLDDAGHETNNRQGYDWKALPGRVGRAVTARDGGFRLDGLADRACYWISVNRPETDHATSAFYAATIDGPNTIHEQLPPTAFNGRLRHEVKTNPITIVFPKIRPIAVTVVGDDTGKPIAGARVLTLDDDSLAAGIVTYGTTDAAGKILLGLPPGRYRGIVTDPPIETRSIRTYQRPLIVERGEGAQSCAIRQQVGVELILQAVGTRPNQPVADAFFWKAPEDKPEETQHIETSTFQSGGPWTDAKGELRAILPPEPGRRYRFRFAGIHEANMPSGISPKMADKQRYEAFPTQSVPVELVGGQTIRLRFILRKRD